MKLVSPEQLKKIYSNKYLALNVAALEARRVIDCIARGEYQLNQNPYSYALERALRGELKFAKLTREELAAMGREGFEEQRPRPV
ncbi:MAG: hypothetical protein ABIK44_04750 [candidate division WOR-3 bacterium]